MTIEDILCETGGFGRFQLFILLSVGLNRFTIGWSMLQMSYAGTFPEWFCRDPNGTQTQNGSSMACVVNNSTGIASIDIGVCDNFHFVGSARTIVNEWNLVCSLNWVKAAVTSIQMVGVLLGALIAGQMGDSFGRKKTLFLFVLEHAVLNIITAFSSNWQMFVVCRFFIGLGIGGVLVTSFPYSLEFLPVKWRPLVSVLPIWSIGICVFALASWLMENWSYLHIACGALSFSGLLFSFFLPESIRWLTVHDRMKEAHDVVMKIAVTNRKLQPRKASITLQAVAWEEQKTHDVNKQYTYYDIFREWSTARTTLIFSFHWFSLSVVYYGISLNASSLVGTIHINIFLLAIMEIPAAASTFYFDNKIGRKRTSIISLAVACVPLLICLAVEVHLTDGKVALITALCVLSKMGIAAAWAVAETCCSEFYPTVTRCLGFGTTHAAASVGALIVPFTISLNDHAVISFIVMASLLLINMVLCIFTPETNGLELSDTPTNIKVVRRLQEYMSPTINNENVEVSDNPAHENGINTENLSKNDNDTVLEIVEEESYDEEKDGNSSDEVSESETAVDNKDMVKSNESPKSVIRKDKSHINVSRLAEYQTENGLAKQSPKASPAPSPKLKRLMTSSPRASPTPSPKLKRLMTSSPRASPAPSPKLKRLVTQSPRASPAPSPKLKRLVTQSLTASPTPSPKLKRLITQSPSASPAPSPKLKRLMAQSLNASPAPSPKLKRLDKLKSGEFFHGKSKSNPKEDSPPYIESTCNKNVRFSIY